MKLGLILLLFGVFFLVIGCNNKVQVKPEEVEHIQVTLSDFEETQNQYLYILTLHNGSSHTIKQNTALLSYSFKTENGSKGSSAVFKTQGNKLEIKPNEKVELTVLVPKDEVPCATRINKEAVTVEVKGYFEEVKDENSFHVGRMVRIDH